MKKVFSLLIVFSSFASADYLMNTSYLCIKSFYFTPNDGKFYYTRSDGGTGSTTVKSLADDIFPDYEYNSTSGQCYKTPSNNTLGISNADFQYLNALIGILIFSMMLMSFL